MAIIAPTNDNSLSSIALFETHGSPIENFPILRLAIAWGECTRAQISLLGHLRDLLEILVRILSGGVILVLAVDFMDTLPDIPRSTPAESLTHALSFRIYGIQRNI